MRKKRLTSKLENVLENPNFVDKCQKVLYVLNGTGLILSTMLATNGYDTGNNLYLKLGIIGQLLSSGGIYATYKFAKESSNISEPLIR
jgi:hypothetical protein